MRTLPIDAPDIEIKKLVVEWNELLAAENYQQALALFPHADQEYDWTPELLQACVKGYGVPDCDEDTRQMMLEEFATDQFKVGSLLARDDAQELIGKSIQVDREHLYGLPPDRYLGMVHFHDVPLSGDLSDLTARFHIKKVGQDRLTLEFLDLHVM